jgi:hypothetical protein
MEKALHTTKIDNLRYYNPDYHRIYFGPEFCQNLLPSKENLEKAIDFANKKALKFTFVTPFVTELGLYRLNGLFQFLKTRLKDCEIVVNDWGVLEVLSKRYRTFNLSIGRLLNKQNRDPSMERVLEKQIPSAARKKDGRIFILVHIPPGKRYQEGIRGCYLNSLSVQKFLSGHNIHRIELNNLIQGLNLDNIRLKVSLYTPFVNIATTRFCPMESRFQKIYRINVCKRECQKYYYRLKNKNLPLPLYKYGNTIFYKNPLKLKSIVQPVIDRIVFQPEPPF